LGEKKKKKGGAPAPCIKKRGCDELASTEGKKEGRGKKEKAGSGDENTSSNWEKKGKRKKNFLGGNEF